MSLFNKLNQIKELKQQAKSLQSQLAEEKVSLEKNGVKLTMDGNQKIQNLEITDELLAPEKKNLLESLIKELHNEAIIKVQRLMAEKMRASGNFNIPGLS
jgi:DNA-binding protein YbaB